MLSKYASTIHYLTKDGSRIRELLHPDHHGPSRTSLAEATVAPGEGTRLHRHLATEEIYHVTAGRAVMTLGDAAFEISIGDTVRIPPGTPHRLENIGDSPLRVLCCCTPPYSHEDTEMLADRGDG
jgi:mannose-6-phosphate isomerase-like protein (cupin superfamily)